MSIPNDPGLPSGGAFPVLTTAIKTINYTALPNDFVRASTAGGVLTITLPPPTVRAVVIGVLSTDGTGALPTTISTPSGAILGKGVAAAATSILLGAVGAYVILESDGTNWQIIAGEQDSGWIAVTVFANGWSSNGGPISYRLTGNILRFKGLFNLGTSSTSAFVTPVGYRVLGAYSPIAALGTLTTQGAVQLGNNGNFTVVSTAPNTAIDGLAVPID